MEHSPTGKGKLMHAVIRKFPNMQNVKEAARRAETGLGPILKQQPGFKGYYIIQFEGGGGALSACSRTLMLPRRHTSAHCRGSKRTWLI